eukprot:gene7866-9341_t
MGSLMHTKLLTTTKLQRSCSIFLFENHFEFLQIMGRGAYSEVYKVRHHLTGELYAVKKSSRPFDGRADRQRMLREVRTVNDLPESDRIVKYYRGWQQDGFFYMQMEFCAGGCMRAWLDRLQTPLAERAIWTIAAQVCEGLHLIHSCGEVHLDIKPANLLFSLTGEVKIGDFGTALTSADVKNGEGEEGDCIYLAPEVLTHNQYTPAADMFSFGLVLLELAAMLGTNSLHQGKRATPIVLPQNGDLWHMLREDRVGEAWEHLKPSSHLFGQSHDADADLRMPGASSELCMVVQCLLSCRAESRPTAQEIISSANEMLQAGL